jgi:hypothetical protein
LKNTEKCGANIKEFEGGGERICMEIMTTTIIIEKI